MKSLQFTNEGEIDVLAVTTFGINVKENENPIGYFGTGLKYAIAVLIRNGCKIRMVSGTDQYTFSLEQVTVRGVEFDFITMNGERLGFTTELGKNWEPWMAYRELHCNTVDESGFVKEATWGELKPTPGYTIIQVSGQSIIEAYHKRSAYLLGDRELLATGRRANAYRGRTSGIFYRGIRISEVHDTVLMNRYDITSPVTLTEDRSARHNHELSFPIMELILRCEDKKFLREVLSAPEGSYENKINFCNSTSDPGEAFLEVAGEMREQTKDVGMNTSVIALHKDKVQDSILPKSSDFAMNEVQKAQLNKARTFMHTVIGCDMDRYPIVVCKSLGKHGLGRAENNTIFISADCFEQGTKRVAAALYEEWTHLDSGCDDETLEQKWIYLNKILSLGEQLSGEPL